MPLTPVADAPAIIEAAIRANALFEAGDMEGHRVSLSIQEAIKELQRMRPKRDEPMH